MKTRILFFLMLFTALVMVGCSGSKNDEPVTTVPVGTWVSILDDNSVHEYCTFYEDGSLIIYQPEDHYYHTEYEYSLGGELVETVTEYRSSATYNKSDRHIYNPNNVEMEKVANGEFKNGKIYIFGIQAGYINSVRTNELEFVADVVMPSFSLAGFIDEDDIKSMVESGIWYRVDGFKNH